MIEKIAYYMEKNDEQPNIELAILLCNIMGYSQYSINSICKGSR